MIQLKRFNVVREVATEEAAARLERSGFIRTGGRAEAGQPSVREIVEQVMQIVGQRNQTPDEEKVPGPSEEEIQNPPAEAVLEKPGKAKKGKTGKAEADTKADKEEPVNGSGADKPDCPDSPE